MFPVRLLNLQVELDHLFIWTASGAPEADCLRDFGLWEGSANRHPGQGTACRRFFFHNAMLELLWVENEKEAKSDAILPTRLWDRWSKRQAGASPFGMCFRSVGSASSSRPFPSWDYRPPYLPAGHSIQMAADAPLNEPLWFYAGFLRRPNSAPPDQRQPMDHPRGLQAKPTRDVQVVKQIQRPSRQEIAGGGSAPRARVLQPMSCWFIAIGWAYNRPNREYRN